MVDWDWDFFRIKQCLMKLVLVLSQQSDLPRRSHDQSFVIPNWLSLGSAAICGKMCSRFCSHVNVFRQKRKDSPGFCSHGFCIKSPGLSDETPRRIRVFGVWFFVTKKKEKKPPNPPFLRGKFTHDSITQRRPTHHALVDLGDPVCTSRSWGFLGAD